MMQVRRRDVSADARRASDLTQILNYGRVFTMTRGFPLAAK